MATRSITTTATPRGQPARQTPTEGLHQPTTGRGNPTHQTFSAPRSGSPSGHTGKLRKNDEPIEMRLPGRPVLRCLGKRKLE